MISLTNENTHFEQLADDLKDCIHFDWSRTMSCPVVESLLHDVQLNEKRLLTVRCFIFNFYKAYLLEESTRGSSAAVSLELNKNFYVGASARSYSYKSYRYMRDVRDALLDKELIFVRSKGRRETNLVTRYGITEKLRSIFRIHRGTLNTERQRTKRGVIVRDATKRILSNEIGKKFDNIEKQIEKINKINTELNKVELHYDMLLKYVGLRNGRATKYKSETADLLLDVLAMKIDASGWCDVSDMWLVQRKYKLQDSIVGGRHYSHFSRVKKQIRKHLVITSPGGPHREPVVEWDFSEHHPRILYAWCDANPPTNPYVFSDYERKIGKKLFMIVFNCRSRTGAMHAIRNEIKSGRFSKESSAKQMLQDTEAHFGALERHFYSAAWRKLQLADSDIAHSILLKFARSGEACLPVFDSFIVRQSCEERLRITMESVFHKKYGRMPFVKKTIV